MNKVKKYLLISVSVLVSTLASAQEPMDEKAREKQLMEYIEHTVEHLGEDLKLEYWQVFYVDSILTHDLHAMGAELEDLQRAKISNPDLYQDVQDKWNERIYNAYHKVFNADQWARWLKTGGSRDKKIRDKRAAKK